MDDALDTALGLVSTDETLIIVTSDHTHTMKFGGYSARGTPILGEVINIRIKKNTKNNNNISLKVAATSLKRKVRLHAY